MCEPTTIVMATTAVLSAAMAVRGANQQRHAIEAQAQVQQQQINEQAAQKTNERMEEARKLRAQARVSAAEAGVAGNSIDVLLDDIYGQAGRDTALIESNRSNGVDAFNEEARARMRETTAEMVTGLVGAASQGANAYATYQSTKTGPTPGATRASRYRITG